MKVHSSKRLRQCGSILAVTLILSILLGMTLGSYLYWVRTQNVLVVESQAWNYAIALAEAGIEEGMAQINVNVGTPNPLNYFPSVVSAANGWTGSGTGPFSKTNSSLGYFVTISNDYPPTLYSTATTSVPLIGKTITRTVRVTTATNSLFGIGIATIQGIDMNGKNITVDAYDSADLVHFTNGLYNSVYAFAGGDVAANGGVADVGNATIHGRLLLAPGVTTNLGPQGVVGDMPANWPAQSGVEGPDWVYNDFNKDFADVVVPYTSGLAPNITNGTSYYLNGGNYYVSGSASVSAIYVNGVNKLYVTGPGTFSANAIYTTNTGSTLIIYVGQTSGTASSINFANVNNGGNAFNLQIFGLPTMTSFTLGGNNSYVGTIYAPECNLTLNGGGNNDFDYQGACVVKSFGSNGHFELHYDKNLSRVGTPSSFTCASWKEL